MTSPCVEGDRMVIRSPSEDVSAFAPDVVCLTARTSEGQHTSCPSLGDHWALTSPWN